MLPLVASMGDPSGIGPEILVQAWQALRHCGPAFAVVGDVDSLGPQAQRAGVHLAPIEYLSETLSLFADHLPVMHRPLAVPSQSGRPDPANAAQITGWIALAVDLVLSGQALALTTAPIAKSVLLSGGFTFPGHTEYLADLSRHLPQSGPRGPVMMLAAGDLRTALVTIHEPLRRVPDLLSSERVRACIEVTAQALRTDFGLADPRMVVAGLNPHAGEDGMLGSEEQQVLVPLVRDLARSGLNIRGPYPSDSLFHAEARGTYDAVICMYHDQALIPIKMLDFWGGVNITLGLPFVRTSPDHGTAFDIAGQGLARPDSMIAALRLASRLATQRRAA